MMSIRPAPSMITIAPLDDNELDDLNIDSAVQNGSAPASSSSLVIKQEPLDSLLTPITTTTNTTSTGIRFSNISLPLLQRGSASTLTLAPVTSSSTMGLQGLQSVVPMGGGVFRFTSPSGIQTRTSIGKTAGGQPMFLIPTNNPRGPRLGMRQTTPIKLVPIQPKKTQAVVAPQTKQISTATVPASQSIPNSMSKGIISFSQENPEELVVGRCEPVVSPKFGVSGMIFNSRTVTGGGRIKYTKDYLCNLCKHMSDSLESFKRHFTTTHMFCCDYCIYKAFSRYEVVMHTKATHSEATEDLKGYEMFEEGDMISSLINTVTTTVANLPTIASVTATSPGSTAGLITVPVMGMNGDKLILQNTSKSNSLLGDATTQQKDNSRTAATNGYFTYKIVHGNSPTDAKKYECDLCQYQTLNLKTMYEHASTHTMTDLNKSAHSSTTWECFYCSFRSFEQAKVVKHVSVAHPKQHIQLKRYTSTSVMKPLLSAATGASVTASTTTVDSISTLSSVPSLVIAPDSGESDILSASEATSKDPDSLLQTQADPSAKEHDDPKNNDSVQKSQAEGKEKEKNDEEKKDEEDDDTAMWGCYYCDFEDQDRHNVVAHVKADHSGRKIVITRRRLQKDKAAENTTDSKEMEKKKSEEGSLLEAEPKENQRKDYSSLIIKLKTKTKKENKTLSLLRKELRKGKGGVDSDGNTLPDLSALIENNSKSLRPGLSPESGDLEMPVLEPMVSGRRSPRSPRSPRGDISSNAAPRLRFPIGLKKDIKVKKRVHIRGSLSSSVKIKSPITSPKKKATRVKSDLAFDQAEVVVLDHIPDDLKVDVSQLYVFNKSKQEAKCNICHRKYTGKMASGHMREHLMIHTGERIWGCPYCKFRCNRRFTLYMHVKKVHPELPIKLVRRRPYQICPGSIKMSSVVKYKVQEVGQTDHETTLGKKLRGPRSHREKRYLETAEHAWECPYCSRKDVFKGSIKVHMKTVHPTQDCEIEPKKCDRPLDELVTDQKLPLKKAKVQLFRKEKMGDYNILNEILEENGRNLTMDLDIDDVPSHSITDQTETVNAMTETQETAQTVRKPHNLSHAKYQCPYCSTRGVRPSTVKSHILSVHPDKELYIHDLRVSRRTQDQHHLFVCREQDCKFMTIMQQALYAHVAKNPTHVNPGLESLDIEDGEQRSDLPVSLRASSLRRRSDKSNIKSEVDPANISKPALYGKNDRCRLQTNDDLDNDKNPDATEVVLPASPHDASFQNKQDMININPATDMEMKQNVIETNFQNSQESVLPLAASTFHKPSPMNDQPKSQGKKKRMKTPLPTNHRDGIELNDIPMNCRYCDFAETTDPIMIKDHLLSEHNHQVPIAFNLRERAKRKLARIHMCPMTTCEYASYFEKAFCIHLKEMHSDVFFPFLYRLKNMETDAKRAKDGKPSKNKNAVEVTLVKAEDEEEPDDEITGEEEHYESASSEEECYKKSDSIGGKASRKRRRSSSDDEPEWKPNNRNPRKKSNKGKRRSLPTKALPKPRILPQQKLPSSTNPRSLLYKSPLLNTESLLQTELSSESQLQQVSLSELNAKDKQHSVGERSPDPDVSLLGGKTEAESETSLIERRPTQQRQKRKHEAAPEISLLEYTPEPILGKKKCEEDVFSCKKKQSLLTNAFLEMVTDFPSAVDHVDTRFMCFKCNEARDTLAEMKQHLVVTHHGKVNFCLDLYARYMRKKQSVFICVQPECDFCCKTWDTMRQHWTAQHPETITPDALLYFDKYIENIPAFRSRKSTGPPEKPGKVKQSAVTKVSDDKAETDEDPMNDALQADESQQFGVDNSAVDDSATDDTTVRLKSTALNVQTSDKPDSSSESGEDLPKRTRKNQPRKIVRKASAATDAHALMDAEVKEEHSEKDKSESDAETEDQSSDAETKSSEDSETAVNTTDSQNDSALKKPDRLESDDRPKVSDRTSGCATMDAMYQCSHCTYLSTDKENIQSHLNKEHGISEAEYTEIGAEFEHDGRVNMSVGEHNGQRESTECEREKAGNNNTESESSEQANTSTSSVEMTPCVSRIKPLKLSVKAGEVMKVLDNNESEKETVATNEDKTTGEKDDESSEEETDNDDDSDEDKSEESSSSEEDDSDDEDDSDEDDESESVSSDESASSEEESKSNKSE